MPEAVRTVFFSYARSDSQFVLKVANALRVEGRQIWVDQLDIPKGARWDDEIEKALRDCSCLLVALSPSSTKSQNVLDEVSYALDEKRVVLPILLQPGSIPFRLKRLQYIDFTGDFHDAYGQLVAALDVLCSPAAVTKVEEPMQRPTDRPPKSTVDVQRVEPASSNLTVATGTPVQGKVGVLQRLPTGIFFAAVIIVGLLAVGYAVIANTKSPRPPASVRVPENHVEPPPDDSPAQRSMTTPVVPDVAQAATPPNARVITDSRVKDFVDQYLAAQNRANATELLRFYADRVDYFDQKGVGKDFILKDKQNYYRRWPEVDNRLASVVAVERSHGEGAVQVSYTIKYRVKSAARAESKAGLARDELSMRLVNGELSIIAQRQLVLSIQN